MTVRFAFDPIEERLRQPSVTALATVLGVDRLCIYAWRRRGLSESQADDVAVRVGLHPLEVWPEWDGPEPW